MAGLMMLRAVIYNVGSLATTQGFMEDTEDFDLADYPDVAKVTTAFPHCVVMPLSQLTVNETGVENGDIDSFSATFWVRKQTGGYVAYFFSASFLVR